MGGRVPRILSKDSPVGAGGCSGVDTDRFEGIVEARKYSGIWNDGASFEDRVEASGRPEDRDMVRGRPHDDRRSALGLGGGLSYNGDELSNLFKSRADHDGIDGQGDKHREGCNFP